jgi:hypothetical protein
MNYTELYNTIQTYTENQFPDVYLASGATVSATTQINMFITQAEQRIYNSVQFPFLRKNQYTAITANNKYISLPNDFLSTYSLALITGVTGADLDTGTFEYLLNKDVNFIRQGVSCAKRQRCSEILCAVWPHDCQFSNYKRTLAYSWPNTRCRVLRGIALLLLSRINHDSGNHVAWRQL